jgi:hypothetical protein
VYIQEGQTIQWPSENRTNEQMYKTFHIYCYDRFRNNQCWYLFEYCCIFIYLSVEDQELPTLVQYLIHGPRHFLCFPAQSYVFYEMFCRVAP